jgi:hypothetical protein
VEAAGNGGFLVSGALAGGQIEAIFPDGRGDFSANCD